PEGNSKQARIAEVVDYISGNFAENTSLEIVAKMAGMSTTSFSRNFQIVTGNRFTEFVNRVRISQACSLLYSTDKQISTICFDVGFQNLANFNRQFLKMKGLTPKEYREIAVKGLVSDSLELQ
ncbi:MAG: AraC family transcriptional regulator, partial [Hyphomicrobiales bacterium]